MSNLSNELAKQAKKKGICQDWYNDLRTTQDKEKLLDLYIRGIDFCLSNDYPSNEYIRSNFVGIMGRHGIHLDENISIASERRVIALGKCYGNVETNNYDTCEVFVKHDSEIVVTANGNSFVMVDVFDNGRLSVTAHGNAKVCVNHYGGEIVYSKYENAQIKIREKNQKTY